MAGFCGLLITCATDNTLIYNLYYTDPLFALIGAVYGVVLADESKLECQEKYHRSTTGAIA